MVQWQAAWWNLPKLARTSWKQMQLTLGISRLCLFCHITYSSIYMYVYTYTYIHIYIFTYVYIYMYMYMYMWYWFIYVVKLFTGPSLAILDVIIWAKWTSLAWPSLLAKFCSDLLHTLLTFLFFLGPVIRQFSKKNVLKKNVVCKNCFISQISLFEFNF